MKFFFEKADVSKGDYIDKGQFIEVLKDKQMRLWLSAQDVEVGDADLLFDFIDDGTGKVSVNQLINGISRLKGSARSIDVISLTHKILHVDEEVVSLNRKIDLLLSQGGFERE